MSGKQSKRRRKAARHEGPHYYANRGVAISSPKPVRVASMACVDAVFQVLHKRLGFKIEEDYRSSGLTPAESHRELRAECVNEVAAILRLRMIDVDTVTRAMKNMIVDS